MHKSFCYDLRSPVTNRKQVPVCVSSHFDFKTLSGRKNVNGNKFLTGQPIQQKVWQCFPVFCSFFAINSAICPQLRQTEQASCLWLNLDTRAVVFCRSKFTWNKCWTSQEKKQLSSYPMPSESSRRRRNMSSAPCCQGTAHSSWCDACGNTASLQFHRYMLNQICSLKTHAFAACLRQRNKNRKKPFRPFILLFLPLFQRRILQKDSDEDVSESNNNVVSPSRSVCVLLQTQLDR